MSELSQNVRATVSLSDEVLAEKCRHSELAAAEMISRYIGFIRKRAACVGREATGVIGADDLVQEGLMALVSAYLSYSADKGACFRTYAGVCITNRIRDAVRKSGSIPVPVDDSELFSVKETANSPEDIFIGKESASELYTRIVACLSDGEWAVFRLFLIGIGYDEIASRLSISVKSVDNAMQRSRRKLRFLFSQVH